jgi:predicted dehydrogenase
MLVSRASSAGAIHEDKVLRGALLGCGGRGRSVMNAFLDATGVHVVALADLFPDQLESARAHYDEQNRKRGQAPIEKSHLYVGPEAFKRVAEAKDIDFVLLATPDYFHPEHLAAIVAAGRHCYCEKPAAVDVAGCLRFLEIGEKVKGRLSLDIGFNVRHSPAFGGAVSRVRKGAIGSVAHISSYYHAPELTYPERPGASALEKRIRNFYWDKVLSGDVIVDQNIHMIDMANWALGKRPLKAIGRAARSVRKDPSDIHDHWSVILTYENGVQLSFNSVQFGQTFWDVGARFFGDKGVAECYYSGRASVSGLETWSLKGKESAGGGFSAAGSFDGLEGCDQNKTRSFYDSIVSGSFHNEAREGAEAALSAILAREACYQKREITWEELLASKQSFGRAVDLSKL